MTAEPTTNSLAGRKEWIGLAVLALPTLLISMDTTVMYLAIPAISKALKPGSAQLLWISDIYGFMEAGFLITMGTIGDRIGRCKLLLFGATCFALASAVAAFSASANLLIISRALLGIAGATLLPSTLSLIRNMFHNQVQRTFAIGLWTTCFSAGTMLGPLVGGILLYHFWWGSVFLMGVPVMVLFLLIGPWLLPEFKDPHAGRIDLVSVLLLLATTLPGVYGIKQFAEDGFSYAALSAVIIGLIMGIIFFRRQRNLAHPLVDLKLFNGRAFNIALAALTVSLFSWAGMYLFVGQHLQLVFNMNALTAGLWTVPSALGSIVTCITASWLVKRISRGTLIAGGLVVMGVGMVMMALSVNGLLLFILSTILFSAGCGLAVTLSNDTVVSSAPPQRAGAAAGVSETCTSLGASFGMALLGSIGLAVYRNNMVKNLPVNILQNVGKIALNTLGEATSAAKQLSPKPGLQLLDTAQSAFTHSLTITAIIDALLLFCVAMLAYIVLRRSILKTG